mmetsp:Transcript_2701/g.4749  ORF Transcript_2701/g.4749 Transcript_2701/m.4749 type:complete len:264 (-) Transcript_2701:98-889(-)
MSRFDEDFDLHTLPLPRGSPSLEDQALHHHGIPGLGHTHQVAEDSHCTGLGYDTNAHRLHVILHSDFLKVSHARLIMRQACTELGMALRHFGTLGLRIPFGLLLTTGTFAGNFKVVATGSGGATAETMAALLTSKVAPLLHHLHRPRACDGPTDANQLAIIAYTQLRDRAPRKGAVGHTHQAHTCNACALTTLARFGRRSCLSGILQGAGEALVSLEKQGPSARHFIEEFHRVYHDLSGRLGVPGNMALAEEAEKVIENCARI